MQTYTVKHASADELYQAFIAPATKINGEPSYADLRLLRATIYQNAASVNSPLGGGMHGHLGMVMDATTYATLTPIAWTDPPEPPLDPTIPPLATGAVIANANRAHAQALKDRREFQNLDRALTRIIINSIEPLYLKPFHTSYIGLVGKTTHQILDLLMQNYGHILPQELERNREQLNKPFDATTEPFQILLDRFEDTSVFARDGNLPISEAQLINAGLVALQNTGVLDRFIDQWTDKEPANRTTWLQFKEFFQPRILEYQKGKRVGSGQYAMAAGAQPEDISYQHATYEAMINMAATQTELMRQLADIQAKYAILTANLPTPRQGSRTTTGNNNPRPDTRNRAPRGRQYTADNNSNSYCHTHGYNVAPSHNSETCNHPGPNHIRTATRTNTMGGSLSGQPPPTSGPTAPSTN